MRLSTLAASAVLVVLGFGAVSAPAAGKPGRSLASVDQLETQVLDALNATRRAHGLVPLRASRPLSAAAETHSRAMGSFGFFGHSSRDGSEFWKRVQRFYSQGSFANWSVGENLLWSTTGLDASQAVKLWMASPGHRKNILTPKWREVGLSAVMAPAAPGVFGGRDVVIITSDFGVRT